MLVGVPFAWADVQSLLTGDLNKEADVSAYGLKL
jgi:hypothetical protein